VVPRGPHLLLGGVHLLVLLALLHLLLKGHLERLAHALQGLLQLRLRQLVHSLHGVQTEEKHTSGGPPPCAALSASQAQTLPLCVLQAEWCHLHKKKETPFL